jgi:hypothetical protein
MQQTIRYIPEADWRYGQEPGIAISRRAVKIMQVLNTELPAGFLTVQHVDHLADRLIVKVFSKALSETVRGELAVLIGQDAAGLDVRRTAYWLAGGCRQALKSKTFYFQAPDVPDQDCWAELVGVELENNPDRNESFVKLSLLVANSVFAGMELLGYIQTERSAWWGKKLGLRGNFRDGISWRIPGQLLGANLLLRVGRVGNRIELRGAGVNQAAYRHNRNLGRSRDRRFSKCHLGASYHCAECGIGRNECSRSCQNIITHLLEGRQHVGVEDIKVSSKHSEQDSGSQMGPRGEE